jgi:hypothetical protein
VLPTKLGNDMKKNKIYFMGIGNNVKKYPVWRYHEIHEPLLVNNTAEDEDAKSKGWDNIEASATGNNHFVNWRHDLEDMTAKQLILFAKEEYGVDFPVGATCEQLVKAIWQLTKAAPQHSGRITLLAQTIEMDYDEVCDELYKMAKDLEITEHEEITI